MTIVLPLLTHGETVLGKIGHFCVALIVAAFMFTVFVVLSGVGSDPRATTPDMVFGRADKPFVYRALLPMTARAISEMTPDGIRTEINDSLAATDFIQSIPDVYALEDEYLYEIALVQILMFAALVGFIYSMRYFAASVFQISAKKNNVASLIALLLIAQAFVYGYIYDFSTLFLMTLAYGFLARGKLLHYAILFPIACLNKETSIFLTFVYWLHFHTLQDKRTFNNYLAVQFISFVVIKTFLYWAYRDNMGGSFEFHLPEHFTEYQRLFRQYPLLMVYYGVMLTGIPFLMFYKWDQKPLFLKHAVLMFGPLFFLYLLFGTPFELRVFYEIYPVVFLLALHSMGVLRGYTIREPNWELPTTLSTFPSSS